MAMEPQHLRELVIRPALEEIGLYSKTAEDLVFGTACQESHCGTFLKQLGSGPALGIFQMEPATFTDLWENFLAFKPDLAAKMAPMFHGSPPQAEEMIWNLRFAAAMCRVHYFRVPAALPEAGNIPALADYWKRHYNTPKGMGTVAEFIRNFNRYS